MSVLRKIPNDVWIVIGGGLLLGIVILAAVALTLEHGTVASYAAAPPVVGIVLFLGVTMLGHYAGTNVTTSTAAVRSGIAAGLFGAYLVVLGYSAIDTTMFDAGLVKYLTKWLGIVIAFYFTTSAAAGVLASRGGGGGA